MFSRLRRLVGGRGQRGFTMVEVIVMTSIAAIGVLSTLVVANVTVQTSSTNEKRVAATNLAREGIELVRAARDSNWQASDRQRKVSPPVGGPQLQAWDCYAGDEGQSQAVTTPTLKPACGGNFGTDSPAPGTVANYVAYPNPANGVPYFRRQAPGATNTKTNTYLVCLDPSATTPVYRPAVADTTGNPCPAEGQPFYRRVTVERGKNLSCGGGCTAFSLRVRSYVTWPDRNGAPLVIEEYLTDWRKFQ